MRPLSWFADCLLYSTPSYGKGRGMEWREGEVEEEEVRRRDRGERRERKNSEGMN